MDEKSLAEPNGDVNLPAEFIVRHAAIRDLPAGFNVGQDSQNLPAEFVVAQWMEDLPTRLRTMRVYDLRGTTGVGFYWQGAANPPESIVDFIIESPTGFWVGEFPDGPARFRHVFFPWHEFKKTGIDGTSPDMSRIDGFIWIVHTDGLRRIDHLYASPFGNLHGIFDVQQPVPPPDPFTLIGSSGIRYAGWEPHLVGSCMEDEFLYVVLNAMFTRSGLIQGSSGVRL